MMGPEHSFYVVNNSTSYEPPAKQDRLGKAPGVDSSHPVGGTHSGNEVLARRKAAG